jgi:hypothetical protein
VDDRAFEALFREHYAALANFALRYVRDRAAQRRIVTTPRGTEENIGRLPAVGLSFEF